MGKIKFLKSGLFTSIQDEGRYGYRDIGVSLSGAMDSFSYKISNYLVGNADRAASLEVTMVGPEIKFYDNELISICGGDLLPHINGVKVDNWTALRVKKDDILSFKGNKSGARAYISFAGGLNIEKKMDSFSTNLKAGFGGFNGRTLKANDEIDILTNKENMKRYNCNKLDKKYIPKYDGKIDVRIILGPQDDYFSEDEIKKFLNEVYEVSNLCDRMGYRLNGNQIKHCKSANIISDANNIGAIQVPGDGMPIVLMNDCGTTGGYPKMGTVIYEDICKIAQLKAGGKLRFKRIGVEEGVNLYKQYDKLISDIKKQLLDKKDNSKYYNVNINGNVYNVVVEEIIM